MIQKGLRSQIAFFCLYFDSIPQFINNHHSTAPLRHPHRNNDAILLPREHRNNASILLPRQHHTAAIFLHPPTIASTSTSSSSCCNTTPRRVAESLSKPFSLRENGRPTCAMPGSEETRLLFARPMGKGGPAHRGSGSGTLSVGGDREGRDAVRRRRIEKALVWKSAQKASEERHRVVGELRRQNEKARVDADRGARGSRGWFASVVGEESLDGVFKGLYEE